MSTKTKCAQRISPIAESGFEPKAVMGGGAGGEIKRGHDAPLFRFDNLGN